MLLAQHQSRLATSIVLLLLVSAYLGVVREGNLLFPSLAVYGGLTLLLSTMCYALSLLLITADGTAANIARSTHETALFVTSLVLVLLVAWTTRTEYRSWLLFCDTLFVAALFSRKLSFNLAFALVIATGVGMRCISNYQIAFGSTSDMLPLVKSGLQVFLQGGNPYREHMVPLPTPHPLLMTYLPLTWLSYLPAYLLNIDLRWTNIGADIISALLLWVSCAQNRRCEGLLPALLLSIWFLNPYFTYRTDAEISILGMYLSLFLYAIAGKRFWLLAIAAGLLLSLSQLALIIIPFAFFYMVASIGLRQALPRALLALAVATALIAPFYNKAMLAGVFTHWQLLNFLDIRWARTTIANFNFSVFAYLLRKQYLLAHVQAFWCVTMFVLFLRTRSAFSLTRTLSFAAATLLLFLQFNIVVWTYLFLPVFILWTWAITSADGKEHTAKNSGRPAAGQANVDQPN